MAVILSNIGESYRYLGNNTEALINYNMALDIYENSGTKRNMGVVLNNIGLVYMADGEYELAIKHFLLLDI